MVRENVLHVVQNLDAQGTSLSFEAELLGADGQTSPAIQEIVAMQYALVDGCYLMGSAENR